MAFAMLLSSVLMPAQVALATTAPGVIVVPEVAPQLSEDEQQQETPVEPEVVEVEQQSEQPVVQSVQPLDDSSSAIDYDHKTTLCHATNSATNPYNLITVDYNSFVKSGHDGHNGPVALTVAMAQQLKANKTDWGDIIPAVPEWGYPGKNVPAGTVVLDNDCEVPEGEPQLLVLPELRVIDPCGLDNATLDTTALDSIVGLKYKVQSDGSVKVKAEDGFLLTINGKPTFVTYVYEPAEDSGKLCKVKAEKPQFKDRCGTSKDFFTVKNTEYVEYYWGKQKLVPEQKYFVDDASKVVIKAVSSDDDYKVVGQNKFIYQFTNKLCKPAVKLQVEAICYGVDTVISAEITNPTRTTQWYEVVVTDADSNELAAKAVAVDSKSSESLMKLFPEDGEFTVSVYSYNKEKRGKLLAEKVVETECADEFTPSIFKVNQDGAILPDGVFTVEVCQPFMYINIVDNDDQNGQYDGCVTYEEVTFGYEGNWFAKNVDYMKYVPTTVTITEVEAPKGCKASGPWTFEWTYNEEVEAYERVRYERPHFVDGSWNVVGNTFNLENDCVTPGQGGDEPEDPVVVLSESTDVPMLAETGDARAPMLTLAVVLMLSAVGFAASPLLRRSDV